MRLAAGRAVRGVVLVMEHAAVRALMYVCLFVGGTVLGAAVVAGLAVVGLWIFGEPIP